MITDYGTWPAPRALVVVDMGQHNETANGDWLTWCRVVSWFAAEFEGAEAEIVLAILFSNP